MRKALIVGIDYYEGMGCLRGCVNDAHRVRASLERHSDGSINFGVRQVCGVGPDSPVRGGELRELVKELFQDDSEIALFYFAGHGYIEEATGGYLIASDTSLDRLTGGVALSDILKFANKSPARNKVIVLDSCHSGVAGNLDAGVQVAQLTEGLTILTACGADQYANEGDGEGLFTGLFVDALAGPAANLVGDITPGSVYAHIDQSLGPWEQRPLFKTNVKSFVSLRKVQPPIPPSDLRQIGELFPSAGAEFQLDPSYEPERAPGEDALPVPDSRNTAVFSILQKYNRVNLVIPVGAPHMWHAAMNSGSCKLTALGEHYRRLAAKGRI